MKTHNAVISAPEIEQQAAEEGYLGAGWSGQRSARWRGRAEGAQEACGQRWRTAWRQRGKRGWRRWGREQGRGSEREGERGRSKGQRGAGVEQRGAGVEQRGAARCSHPAQASGSPNAEWTPGRLSAPGTTHSLAVSISGTVRNQHNTDSDLDAVLPRRPRRHRQPPHQVLCPLQKRGRPVLRRARRRRFALEHAGHESCLRPAAPGGGQRSAVGRKRPAAGGVRQSRQRARRVVG
eukprot:1909473-Rhodomonas_salina.1